MLITKYIFKLSRILRGAGFDFWQNSPIVSRLQKKMEELNGIQFKIEIYPDGSWAAESINVDGIITGGKGVQEMNSKIKDAVFTYFEIPPHLCNDQLLEGPNEPLIFKERVLAVK